jgi:hypothetical protein
MSDTPTPQPEPAEDVDPGDAPAVEREHVEDREHVYDRETDVEEADGDVEEVDED